MFHLIAKPLASWAFGQLTERDLDPLLERCDPAIHHTFAGDHCLGGTRHSREAFRAWLERLYRLFPVLEFELDDVLVAGPPWALRIAVTWSDHGEAADGVAYDNRGVHILHVRGGRLVSLHAHLDTQRLTRTLDRMASAGIEEASAPPIGSA